MSILPASLVASVAACLLGVTAAAAGSPSPYQASSSSGPAAPEQGSSAPAGSETPENSTAPGAATLNATVTVDPNGDRHILVASPPVPDTPENRAKYGGPLSNAGRRTQPADN